MPFWSAFGGIALSNFSRLPDPFRAIPLLTIDMRTINIQEARRFTYFIEKGLYVRIQA
jgi:hypothetical protein